MTAHLLPSWLAPLVVGARDEDINRLVEEYAEYLKLYEVYRADPSDAPNAYAWLNSHPVFWTRATGRTLPGAPGWKPEMAGSWRTDFLMEKNPPDIVREHDGGVVVWFEDVHVHVQDEYLSSSGDRHNWVSARNAYLDRIPDIRLATWKPTYEEALVEVARLVDTYYDFEGNDRDAASPEFGHYPEALQALVAASHAQDAEIAAWYEKRRAITTFTGVDFQPFAPTAEMLRIEDIAHSLSLQCRANGHVTRFFSVAQHSINAAHEAAAHNYSAKVKLACLLHDASGAYLTDLPRPIMKRLGEYQEAERVLQTLIYEHYLGSDLVRDFRKVSFDEDGQVEDVDDAMLAAEFAALMHPGTIVDESFDPLLSEPDLRTRPPEEVEAEFLALFHSLAADNVTLDPDNQT
ncbi:MAG: hypothetical protein LBH13_00890 [Cellulomonadaceae bacterium]|nr:hypothetical protein [Cellulomonadaceae bacterium]